MEVARRSALGEPLRLVAVPLDAAGPGVESLGRGGAERVGHARQSALPGPGRATGRPGEDVVHVSAMRLGLRQKLVLGGLAIVVVVSFGFTLLQLALARQSVEEDLQARAVFFAARSRRRSAT